MLSMSRAVSYRYSNLSMAASALYLLAFPATVHFVTGGELFGAFFVVPLALVALGWGQRVGLITTVIGIVFSEVIMNTEHFVVRHLGNSPYWFTIIVAPVLVYLFIGFLVGRLSDTLRKQHEAEAALAEQEKRYRSIIENLAIGVFIADKEETITFANPTAGTIFGAESERIIGRNLRAFLSDEDDTHVRAETSSRSQGRRSTYEIDIRRLDGEVRHVQVTASPRYDAQGKFVGTFGTMLDITDRDRVKALLQTLLDNVPDFIYFKDLEGRFTLTNRAHAQLVQLSDPSQMIGRTDFDFFSFEDSKEALEGEKLVIETGRAIVDRRERKMWPDRPEKWISATKMPLRNGKGEIIGTFGISRDITEHRRIEERNLLLAAMVASSNDAIIGIGLDDLVTSWNRGAEKLFGYTAQEVIERPITAVLSPDMIAQMSEHMESLPGENRVQRLESLVTRKDGSQAYISYSLSPVIDEKGSIVGLAAIVSDETQRKALQTQIIRSQRLESLATLAAGIAHQFNNANTVIRGYLDLLAGDKALSSTAQSNITEALKAVHRMVEITERLQGFTSAGAPGTENLRLEEVLPTFLQAFEERFQSSGIRVEVDLQETLPIRDSRTTLGFIVTSLLTNSVHALIDCPSPVVTVRTGRGEGFSLLAVSDNGCGIPQENLKRIFTPFFTTKGEWAEPRSPQARMKGVGLSLAVCQSAVAESGGWIEVESVHGQGATFRVWFTAAQPQSPIPSPRHS